MGAHIVMVLHGSDAPGMYELERNAVGAGGSRADSVRREPFVSARDNAATSGGWGVVGRYGGTLQGTSLWNASLFHRSAPRTIPSNNPEARGVTMRQILGIGTVGAAGAHRASGTPASPVRSSRARGSAGECHDRVTDEVRRQTLRCCNVTVNSNQRRSVSVAGAPLAAGKRNVIADSATESVVSRASPAGKPFNFRMYATVAA